MTSILIIEDNFKMRSGLVELLTDEGYSVDSTGNGKHGLEFIKNKDYDIIMTDLIMPFIGGMEILHQVKQSNPKTHVILITAYATVENAVEAMKSGASEYITKPFKIDEVKMKIRKIIAESDIKTLHPSLDPLMIKAMSNPIRSAAVRLLGKTSKLRFTDIKNILEIGDPTKLSFHLRVLKRTNIVEQDEDKKYSLTFNGKNILDVI
ncbi:MAG TPA: response regulator [Nitrososphaerales archaeon]